MAVIILGLTGAFLWSANQRWGLLKLGAATHDSRFDRIGQRLAAVWTFAFYQKKMRYYFWAGIAHQFIFLGFVVLLVNTLVLWGRGFDAGFTFFGLLAHDTVAGQVYTFFKDTFAVLVLLGVSVFVYYRVIKPQKRMALSIEGLVILGIIGAMMIADILYNGAALALNAKFGTACNVMDSWCTRGSAVVAPFGPPGTPVAFHPYPEPAASAMSTLLASASVPTLVVLANAGFWVHSSLVLIFLNILPYSKHFHIITAVPNVFFTDLTPRGRLQPVAKSSEDLMGLVEKASEGEDQLAARIGYARIEHFSWKDALDFYTCTECGRCSDNCPAATTGKILSPKFFTLDLRDHLYSRDEDDSEIEPAKAEGKEGEKSNGEAQKLPPVNLVPNIIHPDVLWACTTCRACEEQCPVLISYVDKIVQMRRNLVMIRGESFPPELMKPLEGIQTNGNPWNLSRVDRTNWAEGLDIPRMSDKPEAEVLYWVGCAASYDDRAKKIARATASLLKMAGIDFAILGDEETCTGDPARRGGDEMTFLAQAEANVATLNGYQEKGGIKRIITTCPHCFNTLLNEYPDFGAKYEVVHHTDYLLGLLAEGKLKAKNSVKGRVVYHDSCYLGRYNDIYDPPREILARIPGVELVEAEYWTKNKGLCCGAGGAQMFMEEQNKDRVNVKRTKQLMDTGATTIASACPFCMTMLTDGIKAESKEDSIKNLDVVELLAVACGVGEKSAKASDEAKAKPEAESEAVAGA
jgi:Fe-S oxidoreductase